jgi:hypothetical protein
VVGPATESGNPYTIHFSDADMALPKWVEVKFADVEFGFYISRVNWPAIIPSLKTVESPIHVQERRLVYRKDPLRQAGSFILLLSRKSKISGSLT